MDEQLPMRPLSTMECGDASELHLLESYTPILHCWLEASQEADIHVSASTMVHASASTAMEGGMVVM